MKNCKIPLTLKYNKDLVIGHLEIPQNILEELNEPTFTFGIDGHYEEDKFILDEVSVITEGDYIYSPKLQIILQEKENEKKESTEEKKNIVVE